MFIVKQVDSLRCHRLLQFRKDRNVWLDFLPNGLQDENILAEVVITDEINLAGQKRCVDHQVVRRRKEAANSAARILRQIEWRGEFISRIKFEAFAGRTGAQSTVNVIAEVVLADDLHDGAFARFSVG